jgi:hypothetical protein
VEKEKKMNKKTKLTTSTIRKSLNSIMGALDEMEQKEQITSPIKQPVPQPPVAPPKKRIEVKVKPKVSPKIKETFEGREPIVAFDFKSFGAAMEKRRDEMQNDEVT